MKDLLIPPMDEPLRCVSANSDLLNFDSIEALRQKQEIFDFEAAEAIDKLVLNGTDQELQEDQRPSSQDESQPSELK